MARKYVWNISNKTTNNNPNLTTKKKKLSIIYLLMKNKKSDGLCDCVCDRNSINKKKKIDAF